MKHLITYNEAFTAEDRLKFIDKEIKRLMGLTFEMEETEEKELLNLKISELLDERDELRSDDGSLPPAEEEEEGPKKNLFVDKTYDYVLNTKTGKYEPAFSETLPPLPVGNRKTYNYYNYKRSRQQLADDTPVFETKLYHRMTSPIDVFDTISLSPTSLSFLNNHIKEVRIKDSRTKSHTFALVGTGDLHTDPTQMKEVTIREFSDEWFHVAYFENYSPYDDDWAIYETWVCDQMDGVLQLLSDKMPDSIK